MTEILLIAIIVLVLVNIVIGLRRKVSVDISPQLKEVESSLVRFNTTLEKMEKAIRDEFQRNRNESSENSRTNRDELAKSLKSFEGNSQPVLKNWV